MGSVCHGYMCILLCWNLIWCIGFPEIYAQLEEWRWGQSAMGKCAFCYIRNICGVVVLHISKVNQRTWVGSFCHGYMCLQLYGKLFHCSVVA